MRDLLIAAAVALAAGGIVTAATQGSNGMSGKPPATKAPPPQPPASKKATGPKKKPPPAPAPATTQPALPPTPVAMSWDHAGTIVWHWHDTDPDWLGHTMRAAGFGWVAVFLGEGGVSDPPDLDWINRFRAASGLPVGGWSVLGVDPAGDAFRAVQLIRADRLSFYIADAEFPYNGRSDRSRAFVSAFRAAQPKLPAGLSSFCNATALGLAAWANAGFVFLPQAYVNDFGAAVAPAACVRAAAPYFAKANVHPTVAYYQGVRGYVPPAQFAALLAQAGTTGFSIYPAETLVNPQDWQTYASAIASKHIAASLP